jgi:hypothetical protein
MRISPTVSSTLRDGSCQQSRISSFRGSAPAARISSSRKQSCRKPLPDAPTERHELTGTISGAR